VTTSWFLETMAADGSRMTYEVVALPFRVAMGLSRRHAELSPTSAAGCA
jgi:hypothetical protein